MVDEIAVELERLVEEVAKELGEIMDAVIQASEEVVEQMQATFAAEIEPHLRPLIDPILEAYLGIELPDEMVEPFTQTIDPLVNNHPACVGCANYHGQVYSGNLLVCAMHPYGWEDEKCPDWRSIWGDS